MYVVLCCSVLLGEKNIERDVEFACYEFSLVLLWTDLVKSQMKFELS